MVKILLILTSLIAASAFASPLDHTVTLKERLRISLWVEGLTSTRPEPAQSAQKKLLVLPEEIERPLSKM